MKLNDCAQCFVFVFKFCPNELMRFLKIGQDSLPYLKFPPHKILSLASSPESRFSPCSLRNLEYFCVICRYFPCFPLFPTLFRTPPPALSSPSSRTPPTPFSPGPPPPVLFDYLLIIAVYHFSFLSRLFRTKFVVDFFLFIISI